MSAAARPQMTVFGDGVDVHALLPVFRFRFMFSDGSAMDVHAAADDSNLRGAVLERRQSSTRASATRASERHADDGLMIVGVAEVEHLGWCPIAAHWTGTAAQAAHWASERATAEADDH